MDSRIPLMGQPIDFAGSYSRGLQLAQQQNQVGRENALTALYQQQGPQIAAGDPGALNALAGFDPVAAVNIQQTRQGMSAEQERLQLARDAGRRAAEEMAKQATREQLAAEAEKGRNLILQGTAMYEAWQAGDQGAGLALGQFLKSNNIDATPDSFLSVMAMTDGALETMKAMHDLRPQPTETFRPATPQEAAQYGAVAGQIDQKSGRFYANNPPSGMSITTADGTTIRQGPGAAQGGALGGYKPTDVSNVIASIDAIAADPALNRVVGPIEGGGGNNVDDLGTAQRMYYRGDGLALIQRIGQLQSTTWLAARDMLKGGGAITDYESKKAEAAMARLSRATSEKEFRSALSELRDAVTQGQAKLAAANQAGTTPQSSAASAQTGAADQGPPEGWLPDVWAGLSPEARAFVLQPDAATPSK